MCEPRRQGACPRLPRRYCVQLCMSFIEHPRQISEPYDLFVYMVGGHFQVN